jgi:hypothetical protein
MCRVFNVIAAFAALGLLAAGMLSCLDGGLPVPLAPAAAADGLQQEPNPTLSVVRRAETTPLRRTDGTDGRRVEKDQEGHVTALLLNGMQLSPKEIQELATLPHLRRLVLYRTNLVDKDLRQLRRCTNLEHVNLSSTNVTHAGINELLELKKLESLCLGDVDITADAMARLKEGFESRGQDVRIGYSPRTK